MAQDDRRPEPLGEPFERLVQLRMGLRRALRIRRPVPSSRLLSARPPACGQNAPSPSTRPSAPPRRASSPASRPGGSNRLASPGSGTSPAPRPRRRGGGPAPSGRPTAPSGRAAPPAPRTPRRNPRHPDRPGTAPAGGGRAASRSPRRRRPCAECLDVDVRCSPVAAMARSPLGVISSAGQRHPTSWCRPGRGDRQIFCRYRAESRIVLRKKPMAARGLIERSMLAMGSRIVPVIRNFISREETKSRT